MRKCGTVLRVDVALTPEGRSRGFGVVLFGRIEDAQKAIEVSTTRPHSEPSR